MARHETPPCGRCWIEYRWAWGQLSPAFLDSYPVNSRLMPLLDRALFSRLKRVECCFENPDHHCGN